MKKIVFFLSTGFLLITMLNHSGYSQRGIDEQGFDMHLMRSVQGVQPDKFLPGYEHSTGIRVFHDHMKKFTQLPQDSVHFNFDGEFPFHSELSMGVLSSFRNKSNKTDGMYEVTFKVNMAGAVTGSGVVFDTQLHQVYISGTFADWAMPGTNPTLQMLPEEGDPEDDEEIYVITLSIPEYFHNYKFFIVENEPTWDLGEWDGPPDRSILVLDNLTISDDWGIIEVPQCTFKKPELDQTFEAGVDNVIPVEIEVKGIAYGYYYLYLVSNFSTISIDSGFIMNSDDINFEFLVSTVIPGGNYYFLLEYYVINQGFFVDVKSNSFTYINNLNTAVDVRRPKPNDVYFPGSYCEIGWNSKNVSQVNIYYSLSNGITWDLIESNLYSFDGFNYWGMNTYGWQIPANLEDNYNECLVRIEDASNPAVNSISGKFSIRKPPVQFISPEPGLVFESGEDEFIPIGIELMESIDINYYLYIVSDDWSAYDMVTEGTINQIGVYNHEYRIPATLPEGNYSFLLIFYIPGLNTMGELISNSFEIVNKGVTIEIKRPEDGDYYVSGGDLFIAWNSLRVNNVNIYLSLDNGNKWEIIVKDLESTDGFYYYGQNLYYWKIPGKIEGLKDQCVIRVENSDDPSISDLSGIFNIRGVPAKIIKPTKETVIAAGQVLEIEMLIDEGTYIHMDLRSLDGYYHYIDEMEVNKGSFVYSFSDTRGLEPGFYCLQTYFYNEGIFLLSDPFEILSEESEFPIAFNLDLSEFDDFDLDENKVYLSGSLTNWVIPGQQGSIEMTLSNSIRKIYSASLSLAPGTYSYKYATDAKGQGWDGAEWVGNPYRTIQVNKPAEYHDLWGAHQDVYFSLLVEVDPYGAGEATSSGSFNAGSVVEINASPGMGYSFVCWKNESGKILCVDNCYLFSMPARNLKLTAHFDVVGQITNEDPAGIKIFPNPTDDVLQIITDKMITEYYIVDITGKKIVWERVNDHELLISVDGLKPGVYFMQLNFSDEIVVRKIVVK
jgi:hypothetical protein